MHARLLPLLLLASACTAAPPPPAPAPEPEPAPAAEPALPEIAAGRSVWNRDPGVQLRGGAGGATLPYLFMRLEVLEADSAEVRVRCVHCPGTPEGWIARERVVHVPSRPEEAAGGDLAGFALALRDAAIRQDLRALRAVMSHEFSHQLSPLEPGLLETLAAWEREGYRTLDRFPFLLDRGIAAVAGTQVWAAPPEYATDRRYADLRAGFRRGAEGWEWIFLVRDGM